MPHPLRGSRVNRIFFRFFLLVMLSITVATFIIYFAISRLFGDPLKEIARRQAAGQIFLLEQYVDKAAENEWLVRLNKVREVSEANLEIMSLAAARAALPGNMLRNAQKYAERSIAVSAGRRNGAVEIVIEDDGPGIPPAERERIFEPFYRLDRSRDRATGGFGLGLSIARKAVAPHGGAIRVDRSALGGAKFVVALSVKGA